MQPAWVRETAAADFRRWHGVSQAGNLLVLLTLTGVVMTTRSAGGTSHVPQFPGGDNRKNPAILG